MLKSGLSAASLALLAGALAFTPAFSQDDAKAKAAAEVKTEKAKVGCSESDQALLKSKADAMGPASEDAKSKARSDVIESKQAMAAGDKGDCAAEAKAAAETLTKEGQK